MGRFYKTSKPEYLDFVYKQPNNLLLQAVQKAEAGVDKNLASVADLYGRLKAAALTPDTERRDEIVNSYKRQIDALTQNIFKDPLLYRGFTPDIKALSDDIKDNIERGELAAFESNVKAKQKYSDKLDAQVKSTGTDHISRERADELLRIYDADFKKRKGTLYAGPSAYQTFNTGFITGDLDIFEEADKILKGIAADQTAYAGYDWEMSPEGDKYIVTEKGTNKKVEEADVRKMLESWWNSNERVGQYYNTREREGISGFDREGKRREYDKANVLDFMAEKFGFEQKTKDKTIKNDAADLARKAYLRTNTASTTTSTETDGKVNSAFNAKSGTDAATKAKATADNNVKMKNNFNSAVDRAVDFDESLNKNTGVAAVRDVNGNIAYIDIKDAERQKDGTYVAKNKNVKLLPSNDPKIQKYLDAKAEKRKELKKQYEEPFNTGKGWDELSKSFTDAGFEELAVYANQGADLRGTEDVRAEKQWNTMTTYADDILGGKKPNETQEDYNIRVNDLAFEISQYQHDVEKTDEIIKFNTDKDLEFQSKFNKIKKGLETNKFDERLISSSILNPRLYDDKGKRLQSTTDDVMSADVAALVNAGNILYKQDAYKGKGGKTVDIGPDGVERKIQVLGGTPSEDATKIEFMVDDRQYVREVGSLQITQNDILPEGMEKAEDFYWTQPVTFYEVGEDGQPTGKKVYYDLITRGEDYEVKIDGKPVNETIAEGGGRDLAIVRKKMDSSKQIAKNSYETKMLKGTDNKNIGNVETPMYYVGYNIGNKDINIGSKYNPSTNQVEYYQVGKKGTFKVSEEDVSIMLLNDLKNTY